MTDANRFWAEARMPLLIVIVAVIAAGLVATSLLMPPRRHPADLLGMTTADSNNGLIVTSIKSGSAADRAGIRVGDAITGLDGARITSRALALRLEARDENRAVIDMTVAHDHAVRRVTLKPAED